MSIAIALSSHTCGGCISGSSSRAQPLARATSSAWRVDGAGAGADAKSLHCNSLGADWNGWVYRSGLFRSAQVQVAGANSQKLSTRFILYSAVALSRPCGIPASRPGGSSSSLHRGGRGRVIQNLESRSFSSGIPAGLSSPLPEAKTRIAYGYYLGPAYGYGGGFGFGGGSIFLLLILGFLAVQAFTKTGSEDGSFTRTREKVSVLKLQVGLLGIARNLQSDLERIADRADTSTTRGLHYVLTETVLALLRQPDMCILGTSSADVKRSVESGERRFNQLSLEERGKFDEETLVNVDGNRKKDIERGRNDGFGNEYIVVTVLVAAEGEYKLPAIYSNSDMREALKTLGSIPADRLQGVEILWTPQDKNDTLTERDLLRNYPLLKSL
ncbi:hypothetical protein MPTK1_3g00940 [Marchantia polymorpha subsp. ruderalis]|uniref:Uncharacterized protein n=2 Tax=Marchantia polymorpha TaxID=3197 RepID=A0AAF6AW29_MARPO|nr:hypothetical protein MARPO_0007s0090 [Marchantia polymorpha]BBN03963.1 hypothetical protein Mp_3g00940 [Marchantia polymorpha subsp. ruderalis]|eukprot:PTQ47652.1 hypothetical protein MARPO_0007s0090 [Marchantia polymorpha]